MRKWEKTSEDFAESRKRPASWEINIGILRFSDIGEIPVRPVHGFMTLQQRKDELLSWDRLTAASQPHCHLRAMPPCKEPDDDLAPDIGWKFNSSQQ